MRSVIVVFMRKLVPGVLVAVLGSSCGSTESCGECDDAGKYEFCVDCPDTTTCDKTIREKGGGKVVFTCSEEALTSGCITPKLLEYCD